MEVYCKVFFLFSSQSRWDSGPFCVRPDELLSTLIRYAVSMFSSATLPGRPGTLLKGVSETHSNGEKWRMGVVVVLMRVMMLWMTQSPLSILFSLLL